MATYYNHCQVGIVDASGNVNVIYPQTYASDVKVGTANSSIGITTSSTVQSLISKLGSAATKNVGDLVTNSASSSSTSQAYSCNQINSKLNELNSKIMIDNNTSVAQVFHQNITNNSCSYTTTVNGLYYTYLQKGAGNAAGDVQILVAGHAYGRAYITQSFQLTYTILCLKSNTKITFTSKLTEYCSCYVFLIKSM